MTEDARIADPMAAAHEADMKEYDRCFQRWMSMNSQVWQVPALAMTAQAFLFTIMLSSQTPLLPRLITVGLAILISLLCIHAIRKHRHHQSLDYGRMIELEGKWGMAHFSFSGWHNDEWEEKVNARLPRHKTLQLHVGSSSSVSFWILGFTVFEVAAVFVAAASFVWPAAFELKPEQPTPGSTIIVQNIMPPQTASTVPTPAPRGPAPSPSFTQGPRP